MRPINKGDWPVENNEPVEFTSYSDARPYLIDRLGDYCSYCENQITNPAVEHIHSKSSTPGSETNWYNFLLDCVNCNSIKGSAQLEVTNYYWPDVHNTFLLFDYQSGGIITIKSNLPSSIDIEIALNTLQLSGLNRFGSSASPSDRRWLKRGEVFRKAQDELERYISNNRPNWFIKSIIDHSTSTGFWSIWMQIFEKEEKVILALKKAFPNTFEHCDCTDINRF